MERPYFKGPFWLLPGIQQVQVQLKVKYIEYDVGLTKNYGITVSMQKNQLNL